MVGKEGCDIVDIRANRHITGIFTTMGSNVVLWNRRESYVRHGEGMGWERMGMDVNAEG